jgi:hypothetical protein
VGTKQEEHISVGNGYLILMPLIDELLVLLQEVLINLLEIVEERLSI